MRKKIQYLNALKYLHVSNTKTEVRFYLWNYEIAPRILQKLVPRSGMTISKEDGKIKEKLADIIAEVESEFVVSFREFLVLMETANTLKTKNIKTLFAIQEKKDGELQILFDKIKASEPHVLPNLLRVVKSKDSFDVLFTYTNNEKFWMIPYRREEDPAKKDYVAYLQDLITCT